MLELLFLLMGFGAIAVLMLMFTRSDYLNPATVVPLMFVLCTAAAIYNNAFHGTEVSFDAACLLLFVTLVMSLSSFIAYRLAVGEANGVRDWVLAPRIIRLPKWLVIASVAFCVAATLVYYRDLTHSMSSMGLSGDWNQMMNSYRFASSFKELGEGEGASGLANLLYKIMTAIAFLFAYIGIVNISVDSGKKAKHIILFAPAMICCICIVFTGGRMGMIRLAAGCLLITWVVLNAKGGWRFRLKLSSVLKVAFLIVAASVAFWAVGSAVGRQISEGPLDYITSYIGYSMVLFSDFLKDPGVSSTDLFGSETLVGIYNFLGSHLGIDDFIYTYHMEWRYIGNLSLGNVYTAYRYWLHDFGIAGMFTVAVLYGVFYGIFYAKARCYRNKKRRVINYPLLMFSYIVYGVFLIPINDCLLATELVVTTPFVLIAMYALGRYVESIQEDFSEVGLSDPYKRLSFGHAAALREGSAKRASVRARNNDERGVSVESS